MTPMTDQVPLLQEIAIPSLIFLVALIIRSIFSFLETTITALRLFKLKELARITSGRYDKLFHTLERTPHKVIITTLIASNVADVTSGALATHITETIFTRFNLPGGLGLFLGIGLASVALIFFGEIIPKNMARARGEQVIGSMLWLINGVFFILKPLAGFLTRLSDFLLYHIEGKAAFSKASAGESVTSEQEIKFLIEYIHTAGLMEQEKGEMLRNIFELGNISVNKIAIAVSDIIFITTDMSISEVLSVFAECRLTRLPVYQKGHTKPLTKKQVIGMVHLKDIFTVMLNKEEKSIESILRPIDFVQENIKVNQLLRTFRQHHVHIAMVLDTHDHVSGLITLEDILEEIVGEINDEHESIKKNLTYQR